jgi:2-dehydro-3-deoxygluconokinase
MAKSLDVVTYGEALAVFAAAEPGPLARVRHFAKGIGGAELNVAIGLARLGFRVGWSSRVGRDSFGTFVLETLAREGIDASAVIVDDQHRTGFYLKSRTTDGSDPDIEYFRAGSAASFLSPADYRPDYFAAARRVHLSGVGPAISDSSFELAVHIATRARAAGQGITFDPNLRPRLWRSREEMIGRLNQIAALAQWVLPGLDEGRILTGASDVASIARFYLERGAEGVAIKLGRDGAYVRTASLEAPVPAAPVAKVVDTVGAGDGFAAGFISALLEGRDALAAAARGNLVAGMVIQAVGDSEGLPTRELLDAAEKSATQRPVLPAA